MTELLLPLSSQNQAGPSRADLSAAGQPPTRWSQLQTGSVPGRAAEETASQSVQPPGLGPAGRQAQWPPHGM